MRLTFIYLTAFLTIFLVATLCQPVTIAATSKPSACQVAWVRYESYEGDGIKGADLLDAYQQACGLGPYSVTAGESCDVDSAAEQGSS